MVHNTGFVTHIVKGDRKFNKEYNPFENIERQGNVGYKVGIVGVAVGFLPGFLVAAFTAWMTGPYSDSIFLFLTF